MHVGVRSQQIRRVQISREFFIAKQRMNLLVTGRTDIYGGAKVLPVALIFSLGLLTRREVMFGELRTLSEAKFADWHRDVA